MKPTKDTVLKRYLTQKLNEYFNVAIENNDESKINDNLDTFATKILRL
jgi:hypothetical protein